MLKGEAISPERAQEGIYRFVPSVESCYIYSPIQRVKRSESSEDFGGSYYYHHYIDLFMVPMSPSKSWHHVNTGTMKEVISYLDSYLDTSEEESPPLDKEDEVYDWVKAAAIRSFFNYWYSCVVEARDERLLHVFEGLKSQFPIQPQREPVYEEVYTCRWKSL